jgi:O-antigen/teichoic acid export membrane protein
MIGFFKRKAHNLVSDKKFSEILTGSAWALCARVLATGFGLIASIIIARFYGANIMGMVAVVNSFMLMATIFTVLGTDTSILRFIPEHLVKYSATSAFKVYRKTQLIVIAVSLITGFVFFMVADLIAGIVFSKPHLSFYFALSAAFVILKSLMLLNTQAVRGLKLIKVFAIMQLLPQGFNLILLIVLGLFWSSNDVPIYALLGGFAMTGIAGWGIMEYSFRKIVQPNDVVGSVPARKILSTSMPMLMTQTMAFVIGQTGVILLGVFRSEAEVGYYAIAVRLATLTTFVLVAINSMAGPKFSELFHTGKMDELFHVAKKSTKLIFWATSPILLGLIILGSPVLSIVFGGDFALAYPSLVFLSIGQFISSISGSTGFFMNMTGCEKNLRNIILGAAVINVLMNLILIPPLGMVGAAVAAMTSVTFWNVYTLLFIRFKFGQTIGYLPGFVSFSR